MENENVVFEGDNNSQPEVKVPKFLTRKTKRLIFYTSIISIFVIETLIWYVYVNASTFVLAFQEYEATISGNIAHFVGFKNFETIITLFKDPNNFDMIQTSLLMYAFHLCVGTVLALFLSYYVYKKMLFGGFFRVILFLPSIMSSVVMVTLYKYMVNDCYMEAFNQPTGLLKGDHMTSVIMVIVYNLWMGYGTDVLMYTGAMGGINPSVVEASELDGCNALQEFIYVTIPCIFPTFITFIVAGLAHIFTNNMSLYTFYAGTSDVRSVGYFMYCQNKSSPGLVKREFYDFLTYPELSALSLMITVVTCPIVLTIRFLLNKYGPNTR